MTATDRPVLEWNTTVKTVLAAAAIAVTTLALASPAHAIQRNSVPTHLTIQVPDSFPKAGYGSTFTAHLSADNGKVPDNATIRCFGHRAEGWFGTPQSTATVDPTTGDAQVFFSTPGTGHWHWDCGTWFAYTWTIYQGSGFSVDFVVTEPEAG